MISKDAASGITRPILLADHRQVLIYLLTTTSSHECGRAELRPDDYDCLLRNFASTDAESSSNGQRPLPKSEKKRL